VPPGYVRGPKAKKEGEPDRRLTPQPIHAETIRQAYAMAKAGESYASIAEYLNERGLPVTSVSKGEKPTFWQPSRIKRLLANAVYLGEAHSGGIVRVDAHEPLVDRETWLLAQRGPSATQEPRRPNRSAKAPPSILSGIVRCAGCSFAMKPQEAGKTAPALYRCVKTSVSGRCPSPSVITKQRIEDYVIERFLDEADTYLIGVRDNEGAEEGRSELLGAVTVAEASYRAQLGNVELRRMIGDSDHDALIASLYQDWQDRLTELEEEQSARPNDPLVLPEGVSLRELVKHLRDEGRNSELRDLLAAGIEAVFVRPAKSRKRNEPVEDRVRVIFRGSEKIDLPKRGGQRFAPRSYAW
jgi:hypothetical protein